jgi:hypothetical protein
VIGSLFLMGGSAVAAAAVGARRRRGCGGRVVTERVKRAKETDHVKNFYRQRY